MKVDATRKVRDLAVELPGATRIFEKLGIDYCCGGNKSLEKACASAKVPVEEAVRFLEQAELSSKGEIEGTRYWQNKPLFRLIAYIVNKYHYCARQELTSLERLLDKVCSIHAENHPELSRIQFLFRMLNQELLTHMLKEEHVLFPYIIHLEEAMDQEDAVPTPGFGTVGNPTRMMMLEHENAAKFLQEIRSESSNFTVPPDACISYKALYQSLQEFEHDLHQHIHMENNILFPRALEMEKEASLV